MIVILGESGSGKSTLCKLLTLDGSGYKRVVTYTTRPIRPGEEDGNDYHFVNKETFGRMVQHSKLTAVSSYNGWLYGMDIHDCQDDKSIAVVTPSGLRTLNRRGIDTVSIYLWVDRRTRLITQLTRGDNIDEAYRRNCSDVGQFDGILDEVDFVIRNTKFSKSEEAVYYEALRCLESINK